jgi:hypothetical protein
VPLVHLSTAMDNHGMRPERQVGAVFRGEAGPINTESETGILGQIGITSVLNILQQDFASTYQFMWWHSTNGIGGAIYGNHLRSKGMMNLLVDQTRRKSPHLLPPANSVAHGERPSYQNRPTMHRAQTQSLADL